MMQLAFYKGRTRLFDRAVQWWTRGPYSHVELVFSDGRAASASTRDGGVRIKYIKWNLESWDFITVNGDETLAKKWFEDHTGEKYDYIGLFGFLWRPYKDNKRRWFCSEAVLEALQLSTESWRFCPNTLASIVKNKS